MSCSTLSVESIFFQFENIWLTMKHIENVSFLSVSNSNILIGISKLQIERIKDESKNIYSNFSIFNGKLFFKECQVFFSQNFYVNSACLCNSSVWYILLFLEVKKVRLWLGESLVIIPFYIISSMQDTVITNYQLFLHWKKNGKNNNFFMISRINRKSMTIFVFLFSTISADV